MKRDLFDLYSDYLLSSFSLATATGLAEMTDGAYSHDQITRMLGAEKYSQKQYWQMVKPVVRQVEREDAAILIDDTLEEKPHTDESELITWHYDHSQGRSVKGVNLLNFVYHSQTSSGQDVSFPVAYETVIKARCLSRPENRRNGNGAVWSVRTIWFVNGSRC